MRSVEQALEECIASLELTDNQRHEAERQRNVVLGHLQKRLSVKETFISGSYGRRTAIRPPHDIDLFVTLNRTAGADLRGGSPDQCLKQIRAVLHEAYPGKELPTLQGRSVNIEFSGTDLGFDVVPAFEMPGNPGMYEIPDRNTRGWIPSNPRLHEQHSIEANQRAGNKAKPLVKALKHWNRNQPGKRPLRSFHLELMVYEALQNAPRNYADGLALLFEELARRVMWPCRDPAVSARDVAEGFSQQRRERAQRMLGEAAKVASNARDAGQTGRTEEAHFHWRSLFGSAYPEPGKAPDTRAAAVSVQPSHRSPDDPGKRFG